MQQEAFYKYLENCKASGKYKSLDVLLAQELAEDEETRAENLAEGLIS